MTAQLVNLYAQEFSTTVQLLSQQGETKFRNAVMTGMHQGNQASPVDQYGTVNMNAVTTRNDPIAGSEVNTDRRWVTPMAFDCAVLVDQFEKLRLISDPQSPQAQAVLKAAKRQVDDLIIDAFFATALTGVSGGTSTSFSAGQQLSVNVGGTTSNMNVEKLRQAAALFGTNDVDLDSDELYCAIGPLQNAALLREVEATSADYKSLGFEVVNGRLVSGLGMKFIHTTRLDTNGSGYRRCPVWVKSGMHLGIWADISTDISQRTDLRSQPWQVYVKMMMNATRLEEVKVVEIPCSEA